MQKMIYIREEDVQIFEEAQRMASESLSTVIAQALKSYVTDYHLREQGFSPLVLTIGKRLPDKGAQHYRKIRFTGRLVSGQPVAAQDDIWRRFESGSRWQLYITPKQGWVAVREAWEHNAEQPIPDYEDLYSDCFWTRDFWTASSIDELRALKDDQGEVLIPTPVIEEGLQNVGVDFIEELDI